MSAALHQAETGEPALRTANLRKVYRVVGAAQDFVAVANVSCQIDRGRTLAVVGESGSGKTTLARMIAGVLKPSSGDIWIAGKQADSRRSEARRAVQMVFQSPYTSLNPRMTILETVREPLDVANGGRRARDGAERAEQMIVRVGLKSEMLARYPHQLSGGQLQRVGIARALIAGPSLVVCDEPTSALDVSVQARVMDLLRELQAELGISYLFVSHDLALVSSIADQVMVMRSGEVVEAADTRSIFTNPRNEYTRKLLDSIMSVSR